jgi:hypothetical protein
MPAAGKAAEDAASITTVVQKIRAEQDKLDNSDAPAVSSHLALGQLFTELRQRAKRTWGKQVKALGYDRRVASRYFTIGTAPLTEMGLSESHVRAMLPPDVMKLEWVCRLTVDQLEQLTAELDVKKASRTKVIRAVKKILGVETTSPKPDLSAKIGKAIDRLTSLINKISTEETDVTQRHLLLGEMAASLAEVQQTLAGLLVPAPAPPAGPEESPAPAEAQEAAASSVAM